jgi:hemolysin III
MYQGERFNTITHLIGSVLALIGTSVAVTLAARRGGATSIVAVSIYGAMLVLLYLSSTLYHSFRGRAKVVFRVFDHCSIYLLIAGTYTPFTLIVLRGAWGWTLFAVVWTLAILGVVKDTVFRDRYRAVSVILYLAMGWMIIAAFGPLKHALPSAGLVLLAAGGAVYTLGVIFYVLSERVAYTHGVWHLCVIGGSVCHYFAVVGYAVR